MNITRHDLKCAVNELGLPAGTDAQLWNRLEALGRPLMTHLRS
jgi:hypothetical protein